MHHTLLLRPSTLNPQLSNPQPPYAHTTLETAVLDAYAFSPKKDLLAQLLALNLEVAGRIERGEPVVSPGVPKNYPDATKLVTEDSIRPNSLM